MRTHFLEGRKREERVSELGNLVRHKRGLTNWRGGRRSGLVSLEKRGMSQTRTHKLGGGKRGERVGEQGNVAPRTTTLTTWRGRREKSRMESMEMVHTTQPE